MNTDDVLMEYEANRSIKATAKSLGLSYDKVRRILISAGITPSLRAYEIATLAANGATAEEVAAQLGIKPTTVRAFLPYERCPYRMDGQSQLSSRTAPGAGRQADNGKTDKGS